MVKKVDNQELEQAIRRKVAQTYEPVKPQQQLGFVHHNVDCIGCRACEDRLQGQERLAAGATLPARDVHRGRLLSGRVRLQGEHVVQPLRAARLPADLPDRRDLEARRQRRGRYRFDAAHRLPQVRGRLPLRRPAMGPAGAGDQEVQPVHRRARRRAQTLLRPGLHDARPRHRTDRGNLEQHAQVEGARSARQDGAPDKTWPIRR